MCNAKKCTASCKTEHAYNFCILQKYSGDLVYGEGLGGFYTFAP